jgi:hypothetical protein
MPPKPGKRAPGRPRNTEKPVEISLKVRPVVAAYLTELGERFGWGNGHTEVARFLLMREVSRLQERRD